MSSALEFVFPHIHRPYQKKSHKDGKSFASFIRRILPRKVVIEYRNKSAKRSLNLLKEKLASTGDLSLFFSPDKWISYVAPNSH